MKRILSILSLSVVLVVLLAACSNKSEIEAMNAKLEAFKDSVRLAADTAGLAEFQALKAQNELGDYNEYLYTEEAAPVSYAVKKSTPARTVTQRSSSNQSGSMGTTTGNTAKVKKGWSKSAKAAAIGGAAGAIGGAVINKKNRAVGAVIGGVVGGAVGYGIGRGMDKRDGRF